MIEITGLKKSYGERTVLDIASLSFRRGVRYAIIGQNGSGKTTLLRVLAGALAADSGEIDMPEPLRAERGYMPQHPYAFEFSVLRNVQMAFQDQKTAKEPALAALKQVGLEDFAASKGNKLSGGETQRMALARMIARPRGLLLLDEPTSSTDIAAGDLIEQILLEYCDKTGCTLLFSTHSPAQVQTLAQEVVMLDGGAVIESGPVHKVLFEPESPVTRAFLEHWQLRDVP